MNIMIVSVYDLCLYIVKMCTCDLVLMHFYFSTYTVCPTLLYILTNMIVTTVAVLISNVLYCTDSAMFGGCIISHSIVFH